MQRQEVVNVLNAKLGQYPVSTLNTKTLIQVVTDCKNCKLVVVNPRECPI